MILLAFLFTAPLPDRLPGDLEARFQVVASKMAIFQPDLVLYGPEYKRFAWSFLDEKALAGQEEFLALMTDAKIPEAGLLHLADHKDPRIRTLALAVLFHREDPRHLPILARARKDHAPTWPRVEIRAARTLGSPKGPYPEEFDKQTVGQIAERMVAFWLEPAGYKLEEYDQYARKYQDLPPGPAWFHGRLMRAGAGRSSAFSREIEANVKKLRAQIDELPAPRRDWVLLWVAGYHATESFPEATLKAFATAEDLREAGKRLGPMKLLQVLRGEAAFEEPEGSSDRGRGKGYPALASLIMKHGGHLLTPVHAQAFLKDSEAWKHGGHWRPIAAAHLLPDRAAAILVPAFKEYPGWREQIDLALALWESDGPRQTAFLLDWFYSRDNSDAGYWLSLMGDTRRADQRPFVARLVRDDRFGKVNLDTLRYLIQHVNRWTREPVLSNDEMYHNLPWRGVHPETPEELRALEGWRERVRKSVPLWAGPA